MSPRSCWPAPIELERSSRSGRPIDSSPTRAIDGPRSTSPAGSGKGVRMPGRANFERELQHLQDEMLVLASLVDYAIGASIEALRRLDSRAAETIIRDDKHINAKRYAIEEAAITAIATQQPMA